MKSSDSISKINITPKQVWSGVRSSLLILLCIFLITFSSCGGKSSSKDVIADSTNVEMSDSNKNIRPDTLVTKHFAKKEGRNELIIEYPIFNADTEVVKSIRRWLNNQMGSTYKESLDDAEGFFAHYAKAIKNDVCVKKIKLTKHYENTKVISYTSYYYDEGGAQPNVTITGITFRKTDGKTFSRNMISKMHELKPHIAEALAKAFGYTTVDEFMHNMLMPASSVYEIPNSTENPYFTDEGVAFSYLPYDFTSNSSPQAVVPYSVMKSFVKKEGLTFFEE